LALKGWEYSINYFLFYEKQEETITSFLKEIKEKNRHIDTV